MRVRSRDIAGWFELPKWLIAGALLAFFVVPAGSQKALAAQPTFCEGPTVDDVVADGVAGRAIQGVSLILERSRVHPGEKVYARLVNKGEGLASYGPVHRVERRAMSGWVTDPSGPHGPWFKVLWGLTPGGVGRCRAWKIPPDQVAGTYRFVVPATVNGRRLDRSVVFRIIPE
jgi:hypothetical protein